MTGRGTPLLCGRCPRGKRRTAYLPMAPFCLNDDLTAQNGSTRFRRIGKHQTTTDLTIETGNLAAWPNSRCDPSPGLTSGSWSPSGRCCRTWRRSSAAWRRRSLTIRRAWPGGASPSWPGPAARRRPAWSGSAGPSGCAATPISGWSWLARWPATTRPPSRRLHTTSTRATTRPRSPPKSPTPMPGRSPTPRATWTSPSWSRSPRRSPRPGGLTSTAWAPAVSSPSTCR